MPTETILIEFVTNDEQLKSSEDRLVSMGKTEKSVGEEFKKTNAEVKKQEAALATLDKISQQINSTGKVTKANLKDLSTAVKSMSGTFQKEFKDGVAEALKAAGVSIEQFESALEGTEEKTISLKSQLRQMTQALAQMKVEGKDNTEAYRALAMQAGQLKDAIGDANQEVKNFGSDTSTFDGLIGLTQGVAGGFAVVQGAAALFGDESEELQKTLLRVNAAMAILQGLQQIQVILQKESAAATLASTIATKAQTAAQVLFTFVVGGTTGALKALRIALATTGIGLLIIGLGYLVSALIDFNDTAEKSEDIANDFADALERINQASEDATTDINRQTDLRIAKLELEGAKGSQINAERIKNIQARINAEKYAEIQISKSLDNLRKKALEGLLKKEDYDKSFKDLDDRLKENINKQVALEDELKISKINNQKEIKDEQKKDFEDAKKRAEEQRQREKDDRARALSDVKERILIQLLEVEKGSRKELQLKKDLLNAELQITLDNDKLTKTHRERLMKESLINRFELEKQFNKDLDALTFANISSSIQADLAQLEVSLEDKLRLTETFIRVQAELERAAAEGNAAKISEIEARRDKAIRDARIASIQEIADYEIRLASATNGPEQRRLQRVIANNQAEFKDRVDAIQKLAELDSSGVARRIQALNEEKEKKLISQRDYDLQYAELIDQQTKIWEDAERAKTEATKAEGERRKQQTIKEIQDIVAVAQQVIGVLEALYSGQSQAEENRLNEQKQRLKDLTDAGAITEKEAIVRQKRIDAEERKIKQQQAQRDKQVAVFRALLAIPEAVLQGLSQGGPILAAIYGALATVQAALVISRPIPKFGKGKKNRYEGLAEVGETGAELIQRGNKMYVAKKSTITYLGADDKVFNPMETKAMLSKPQMTTDRLQAVNGKEHAFEMDYDKLGEAVGKHVQTNVYVDGVQEQTIKKNQFTQWLNNRRSL